MLCVRVHVCIIILVIKNIPLFCSTYHSFEYLHSKQFADCDFENINNYTTYLSTKSIATVPNESCIHIGMLPKDEGMCHSAQ